MDRYICIHGHYYQPPREDPWLEAVGTQDSAYPYHDWNERITAECYAPNARSRVLDAASHVVRFSDNYARTSFNFGPTLLSWFQDSEPGLIDALVLADRAGQARFSGHGPALAQAYNHVIMPLANRRDKRTQVAWGLADFERRFRRRAEGMWLPETAVDLETLDILAEAGVKFTVLAPRQAGRVRQLGSHEWRDVRGQRVDTTRAYVQRLPGGRSIALFFYDGPASRAVAFEGLLHSGTDFANRLHSALRDETGRPQLVHVATDGETYGHHHRFGDMALASALDQVEARGLAQLTVYGEYLEKSPPQWEVEVIEDTSWSCEHGIERWRSACGCNAGRLPGSSQSWRGPLRSALDWLRDTVAPLYEAEGSRLFKDPWAARDEYISVVLDRSPESVSQYFAAHAARRLSPADRVRALTLLEIQRQAMLMYTSCGWFFDDVGGLETVQVLQYAGRLVHLAEGVLDPNIEQGLVSRLAAAKSNVAAHGDGARIYTDRVRPLRTGLPEAALHLASASLFDGSTDRTSYPAFAVSMAAAQKATQGEAVLSTGNFTVSSRLTSEQASYVFGAVFDGRALSAAIVPRDRQAAQSGTIAAAAEAFKAGDTGQARKLLDSVAGVHAAGFGALFTEARREILGRLMAGSLESKADVFKVLQDGERHRMEALAADGLAKPWPLQVSTDFFHDVRLRSLLSGAGLPSNSELGLAVSAARASGATLDWSGLGYLLAGVLDRLTADFISRPHDVEPVHRLLEFVRLAREHPFATDLWKQQHAAWTAVNAGRVAHPAQPIEWRRDLAAMCRLLHVRLPAGWREDGLT
jgi:alpha-amylase/alpha-mannosidase (GH57 family)